MKSRPELATAIVASTFRHLHSLIAQVEQLKAHTGAQRVAEFLLELCPVDEGACAVTLPYDKVLIAGRLGMKPESLSRAFARLRGTGVMVRQNHAAIADVEKLREYVEEDRAASWSKAQ
jgi:CRP-like cAMP-binding protein